MLPVSVGTTKVDDLKRDDDAKKDDVVAETVAEVEPEDDGSAEEITRAELLVAVSVAVSEPLPLSISVMLALEVPVVSESVEPDDKFEVLALSVEEPEDVGEFETVGEEEAEEDTGRAEVAWLSAVVDAERVWKVSMFVLFCPEINVLEDALMVDKELDEEPVLLAVSVPLSELEGNGLLEEAKVVEAPEIVVVELLPPSKLIEEEAGLAKYSLNFTEDDDDDDDDDTDDKDKVT